VSTKIENLENASRFKGPKGHMIRQVIGPKLKKRRGAHRAKRARNQ
jgi:hypothetical protein